MRQAAYATHGVIFFSRCSVPTSQAVIEVRAKALKVLEAGVVAGRKAMADRGGGRPQVEVKALQRAAVLVKDACDVADDSMVDILSLEVGHVLLNQMAAIAHLIPANEELRSAFVRFDKDTRPDRCKRMSSQQFVGCSQYTTPHTPGTTQHNCLTSPEPTQPRFAPT